MAWWRYPEDVYHALVPVTKLPEELVGMIISYFIYDIRTPPTCSLTCYSWYIAVVPHLHHTLTTYDLLAVSPCDFDLIFRLIHL